MGRSRERRRGGEEKEGVGLSTEKVALGPPVSISDSGCNEHIWAGKEK